MYHNNINKQARTVTSSLIGHVNSVSTLWKQMDYHNSHIGTLFNIYVGVL